MKNIRTDLLHTIEKVETIYKSEINQIASKAKETNKNKKEQAEKQAYQETFDKLVAKLL
ncbi:hypothetical protein GW750_02635 [bacterium]|nr:hypothetical protein [bacterium]